MGDPKIHQLIGLFQYGNPIISWGVPGCGGAIIFTYTYIHIDIDIYMGMGQNPGP